MDQIKEHWEQIFEFCILNLILSNLYYIFIISFCVFNKTVPDTIQDMNENNDERDTEKVNGIVNHLNTLFFFRKENDESSLLLGYTVT